MDDLEHAREAARQVRREQIGDRTLAHPGAIDIDAVARRLGYVVVSFQPEARPGVLGYLEPNPGEPLLWFRKDLSPVERLFTLAHELGHARLHADTLAAERDECAAGDVTDEFERNHGLLLRPDEAYSPRSRREREANAFATELLAPLDGVRAAFLGEGRRAPLATAAIARAYGVWPSVVVSQLARALVDAPPAERAPVARAGVPPTLDPSQREAVTVAPPALIVAGPGTGKTSTLVARLCWLVTEQAVAPRAILARTLRPNGARARRVRVTAALDLAPGREPTVTTFHSFGADLLRGYGHLVGLRPDFALVDDIAAFLLLRDLGPRLPLDHYTRLARPALYFGDLLGAISTAKDELADPARYASLAEEQAARATTTEEAAAADRAREVAAVYAVYQAELARRGDADYGDLIRLSVRLCAEQPQVLAALHDRYAHVLVDEFQDINRANGVLLKYLAGPAGNIWAVGDANQSIYRFRGASPANIANFHEDFPGARVVALRYNYRSRPAIVAAANRFAGGALPGNGDRVDLAPVRPDDGAAVILREAPGADAEIAAIVDDIGRRQALGATLGDHAILCRTRAQGRRVAEALSAAGLAASAEEGFFENDAIRDLLGIGHVLSGEAGGLLRAARVGDHALSHATVERLCRAAANLPDTPLDRVINDELARDDLPADDRAHLALLQSDLAAMLHAPSVAAGYALYLCDLTATVRDALSARDGRGSLVAGLLSLAAHYDAHQRLSAGDAPDVPANPDERARRRWRDFSTFARLVSGLPHGFDAGAGDDVAAAARVRVLTVHGAKGLEFPVVYVPYLGKGRFPNRYQGERVPPPPGLVASAESDPKVAHLIEEACLFYVAMTRARDMLVLSRAERYSAKQRSTPSEFLAPVLASGDVRREACAPVAGVTTEGDDGDLAPLAPDPPDFAEAEAIKASALATYDECPRQYAYRYGYRLRGQRGGYWRLRHAVAAALGDVEREAIDEAAAVARFDATWREDSERLGAAASDPFDSLYRARGAQSVAAAARYVRAHGEEREIRFAHVVDIAVEEAIVSVELDRVEVDRAPGSDGANPRRAVRHQIDARAGDPKANDLRSYLALLAVRQMTGEPSLGELVEHRLASDEQTPVPMSEKIEQTLRQRMRSALAGIGAGAFSARPDPFRCASCEFALVCPA